LEYVRIPEEGIQTQRKGEGDTIDPDIGIV
jgi:hypothetical protein